ncbi:dipeptidase [Sulfobacillus harzensis]|uniref:Dipeptidase n=1 Tax=Sulfobacillus harzensis TaxID=2729629 RepID=A0A7Y0L1V4_9FIRM|nr:dipeptidase [Sulfobacillus harzensis]NMP21764.1 dipeptidase [Sulfobacillus harzensis]
MPDGGLDQVLSYLKTHRDQHVSEVSDFLRIPSVSALSSHKGDVARAAEWLKNRLVAAGFQDARLDSTPGNPVVVASGPQRPDRPTVLVYGHYDVQPVDPLSSWRHDPFDPTVEDNILYARGASDDKGQVFMQLIAAEAWQKAGSLPVNVKFLFEGEEEIGSVHLSQYIREHQTDLTADLAVISDTPMYADGYPSISYGLRGLVSLEITVHGPFQDLHSGVYGGAVMNPAHALARLIASLHDEDGRVRVAHFYDDVEPLSDEERAALARLPFDPAVYRDDVQVPALFGETGYSTLERIWARPTLEVNGMWSGFTGEGQKTIIPSTAHAKITCRLVPHQRPEQIIEAVSEHLRQHLPPGVRLTISPGEGAPGSITPLNHPAVKAAERAIEAIYHTPASYIRMGGSIPVVVDFQETLGIPTLLLGFALPNENFHAPNEHFHLDNFYRGAETVAALWAYLGDRHE